MLCLVGSTAARMHFPDFRAPNDVDIIGDNPNFVPPAWVEGQPHTDLFVDERLGAWSWGKIATPEELYTMKVSHAFWEIGEGAQRVRNWNKHMSDVVFFQRHGVPFNRDLYDLLLPIWKERYNKKITSLAQNKDNFFADAVKRTYDHDSIHDSIAYGHHALYEDILVPGEQVMVDSTKFWKMDKPTQIKLVREEVYATALERILIPDNYVGSPRAAYAWALRRTITSLFKGEWALFAVLNYDELAKPDCNYLQRHLDNKHKLIRLEQ